MKLLKEQVDDATFLIEETESGEKEIYIEGIFMQSDVKNRNGRIYPKQVLENEVAKYIKEKVSRKTAYGELGHPENPTINPERISHLITELKMDGSNVIGKAKLIGEGYGRIAASIIKAGGTLGVSSRGLGRLEESSKGNIVVDYHLVTAGDIVIDPSAPDAYVDSIMENQFDWIIGPSGEWERVVESAKTTISNTKINEERERAALDLLQKYLRSL